MVFIGFSSLALCFPIFHFFQESCNKYLKRRKYNFSLRVTLGFTENIVPLESLLAAMDRTGM